MKTILISGGHLTPALAVIDQAIKDAKPFAFVFLGRTFSQESSRQLAQEKQAVESRGIPFVPTVAPKFHKTFWWKNLREFRQLYPAMSIAWKTISEYKPDLFLSFGGYLAFPIALVCRLRRIPVITHEQTTEQGLANKAIALLSDKVALSYESSLSYYPSKKTVVTGNPIRPAMMNKRPSRPVWITNTPDKPILYVTGGNQGSEILNSVIEQSISILSQQWYVIHQCGNPSESSNYLKRLEQAKQKLSLPAQKYYHPRTWIDENDLAWIFSNAQLAVSRSGANTVTELIVHALPAVLIPLPFSHHQEQLKNATMLSDANCAKTLNQKDLNPDTFIKLVKLVSRQHIQMKTNYKRLHKKAIINGAENVVALIEDTLQEFSTPSTM